MILILTYLTYQGTQVQQTLLTQCTAVVFFQLSPNQVESELILQLIFTNKMEVKIVGGLLISDISFPKLF